MEWKYNGNEYRIVERDGGGVLQIRSEWWRPICSVVTYDGAGSTLYEIVRANGEPIVYSDGEHTKRAGIVVEDGSVWIVVEKQVWEWRDIDSGYESVRALVSRLCSGGGEECANEEGD